MFRALLATASLAAGVLTAPGAAFAADTVTQLTAAEMSAALKGVSGTTAPAELPGYGGDVQISLTIDGQNQKGTAKFGTDPVHGLGYLTVTGALGGIGSYAQAGKGQWHQFTLPTERAAVAMAGHPAARYLFVPDPKLKLDAWTAENLPGPSSVVTQDSLHAGTKTVHDDGTTDYAYADDEKVAITFSTDTHGVLVSAKIADPDVNETFAWSYGPQTITLPTSAQTVGQWLLNRAIAYLDMAGKVKRAATGSAAIVESKSRKKTVKVANLRSWTRAEVKSINSTFGVNVLVVADVKGGVRISATNPFTKATAAWTVKASGKHAVARKA
ncbi:hypothetical protein [Actinoplanes sp. HUAS TT8]|uniref:hypothetical protein n=1 Tax=Actinoplanes sp. HUAS TT8 TaxID=3447453 RepID=UPI003F527CF4